MSESSAENPRAEGAETQRAPSNGNTESPDSGQHSQTSPAAVERSTSDSRATDPSGELPPSLTFRITRVALLGVLALAVCVTPAAWGLPWLLLLYLLPLALLMWILRIRTVVDADRISARSVLRTTTLGWDEITSFRLDERRWLRAVLDSGKEVWLPAVRVRDLPRVAAMSAGRVRDPLTESAASQDKNPEPDQ